MLWLHLPETGLLPNVRLIVIFSKHGCAVTLSRRLITPKGLICLFDWHVKAQRISLPSFKPFSAGTFACAVYLVVFQKFFSNLC